ncbi:hypothetical protein AJ79_05939 [Helicocarpus griseus UAMH5409]|uniref:Uncharacterized protein n=1 Tax=Helicocarpus griseus UAMH5409 TaxID=1447875 RepID=A0A2B7XJ48_9EURO|nr:hypothetical protein AJ79_05939 [Helicocarpus griseus UAMH5409]
MAVIARARQLVASIPCHGDRDKDFAPKVLQGMVNYLPSPGLDTVAAEIYACKDEWQLRDLGRHYIMTVFKPIGGKSPVPSPPPFADGQYDDDQGEMRDSQKPSSVPEGYSEYLPTKGWLTMHYYAHYQRGNTRRPHACPEHALCPVNVDIHLNLSETWTSLCRIFPCLERIHNRLESINEASNLFTASSEVHKLFGSFDFALEPVLWSHSDALSPVPLPDPELFRVHYVIAQILNATGLKKELDEASEYYELRGLASDGSRDLPFVIESS